MSITKTTPYLVPHTRTPWTLYSEYQGGTCLNLTELIIRSENMRIVAKAIPHIGDAPMGEKFTHEDIANAAFIVRACNSHQDLLDAAILAVDRFKATGSIDEVECVKKLVAAIEKAGGRL